MVPKNMLKKSHKKYKEQVISWQANEFLYSKKGPLWYFLIIFLGIIIGLIFIYLKSYLAATVVFLATLVFLLEGNRKPKQLQIKFTNDGVFIRDLFFPFTNFRSYFLDADFIFLIKTKRFSVPLNIPIGNNADIDRQKIKAFLEQRLPYHPYPILGFNSFLSRLLRF